MNPGILTSVYAPTPMPYGLLGRQTPVPAVDYRLLSDPRTLPQLAAWWDASDPFTVTLNGNNVSEWRDKSGNGFHLTQTTAANQPAYSRALINGLNVVKFGPVGTATHRMINAGIVATSPTIVAAWRFRIDYSPLVVSPCLFDTYTETAGRFVMNVDSSSNSSARFQRGAGGATEFTPFSFVAGRVYASSFIGFAAGGTAALNGVFSTPSTAGSNGLIGISVGNIRGNPNTIVTASNFVWDGDICEMMVFRSQIPDQQRRALERYLADKWGAVAA